MLILRTILKRVLGEVVLHDAKFYMGCVGEGGHHRLLYSAVVSISIVSASYSIHALRATNHLFAQDKIKLARTHTCIKRAGQQGNFGTNSCP